jgi:ligand-binding sensor domain-containing protein
MQLNSRMAAIGVIALGGVVAGVYSLGLKQGQKTETLAAAQSTAAAVEGSAAKASAGPLKEGVPMPPNHPAMPQANAAAQTDAAAAPANVEQDQREGQAKENDSAKFTHFRVGNRNVKSLYVDGKTVWIGTSGGVVRYDTTTDAYKMFDSKSGLLSNGVFHVNKLNGRIVVGTYGGGMSMYDAATEKWQNYNIPQGLGDPFVYGVMKTKSGDVWVATWSGANRVRGGAIDDPSKWQVFTVENTKGGLPNDWVYGLAEGKNGEIWFATEGGLARYKNGQWQNWNHSKGLGAPFEKVKNEITFKNDPAKYSSHHAKQKAEMGLQGVDNTSYNPNYIIAMAVDRDGAVWCGTWGGGLSRFDGSKWKTYTMADGLPGDHVFMIKIDAKGQMWVGTNNGLARFNDGKFSVLTTADGLFSNYVFSMATGDDGSLWVGSFGGVTHLRQ